MTEREIFWVQRFFDQLILVYNNFQSMEITAKKLNKMKQWNKQPFSTFISGFEKKMLKTGGMDFNDQITKTFFNNVLNNEMHKIFIGSFIPIIYTVYCTMFHGMNNQLEGLRSKNGTATTVIKVIGSFTTVNSTTNDEMDWEFINVTSLSTKMTKTLTKTPTKTKKTKWVFPTIINKRGKKLFSLWYCLSQNK